MAAAEDRQDAAPQAACADERESRNQASRRLRAVTLRMS